MSEPNAAFEDFRAGIRYLAAGYGMWPWPVPESTLEQFRYHSAEDDPGIESAIEDLWEQAHTAALFAIDQSRAGQRPVGSHTADIADANPNLAPDTVSFDEQDDPC